MSDDLEMTTAISAKTALLMQALDTVKGQVNELRAEMKELRQLVYKLVAGAVGVGGGIGAFAGHLL